MAFGWKAYQESPALKLEPLMEDLATSLLRLPRSTPQKLKLFVEDLETPALSLPGIPPPFPNWNCSVEDLGTSHGGHNGCGGDWYVETIAVSSWDTVSLCFVSFISASFVLGFWNRSVIGPMWCFTHVYPIGFRTYIRTIHVLLWTCYSMWWLSIVQSFIS